MQRGPKRACPAGIALEDLPTIHAVFLSHNHYDHMDLTTLKWLNHQFAMPIYTGLGNGCYLPPDLHVIEMDWWQSALFKEMKIIYTPAQHGSGRGARDQNMALWGGFLFCMGKIIASLRVIRVIRHTLKKFKPALAHRAWHFCRLVLMNHVI